MLFLVSFSMFLLLVIDKKNQLEKTYRIIVGYCPSVAF